VMLASCLAVVYVVNRLREEINFETALRKRQDIDIISIRKDINELEQRQENGKGS